MNFRQKFEDWHKRTFGYVQQPATGSTAFATTYPGSKPQQHRWEGWQACGTLSFDEGYTKGLADAKAVTDGWLQAVDEALVGSHLGVATAGDTYEQAKTKLNSLICWSIQVDKDVGTPPTEDNSKEP